MYKDLEHQRLGSEWREVAEEPQLSKSGYRIGKLHDRVSYLRESLQSYIDNKDPRVKGNAREQDRNDASMLFRSVENLLSKMDDYNFSDEEKDGIVDMLAAVEKLRVDFHGVAIRFFHPDDLRAWRENVALFTQTFGQRLDDIQLMLDRLPKDRESGLRFESGHAEKLAQALSKKDINEAEKIVLEIDRLIMDDYAEFPKTLKGGIALKFRLGQIFKPGQSLHTIDLSKAGEVQAILRFVRTETNPESESYEFEIFMYGLSTEQKKIWKQIQ